MVKVDYFLFCESNAHSDNGKLSLLNLFDIIYAENFPAAQRPFIAAIRVVPIRTAIVNRSLKMKITSNLKGKEITKLETTFKATIELGSGLGTGVDLSTFVFPEAGDYIFKLFINEKVIAERTLQVKSTQELTEK